jgi:hypothetical protein
MADDEKKVVVKPVEKPKTEPQKKGATLGDLLALKGQTLKVKK